jgi:hypothetical protein
VISGGERGNGGAEDGGEGARGDTFLLVKAVTSRASS